MNFEDLYKLTFQNIFRFFYYKSVNKETIEDLCHDVYIIFYKKYDSNLLNIEESKKILFTISNNLYKEWVRKQINNSTIDFIENRDSDEDLENIYNEKFELKISNYQARIKENIKNLNPTIQNVISLLYFRGLSRKEVAKELGISEDFVHTYQKRGIKYLKKMIHGQKD